MRIGHFPPEIRARRFMRLSAVLAILVIAGCSQGVRSLPVPIPFTAGDGLRKKVAILPFEVQSAYADPRSRDILQQTLENVLEEECPEVNFLMPSDPRIPDSMADVPRLENGSIDNFQLAMAGRRWGLNAVLRGSLSSIAIDEMEKGFWWFKKPRYYLQVEVLVEILDTETATKLLSRSVNRRVEIDPVDVEMINARNQVELYYFEEVLDEIAEEVGEKVCEAIAQQAWKSYVLMVEGGELLIAAGENANLQPGVLLEIFDSSEVVEGVGSHRYILPGNKVGEARVSVVDARVARAAVTSGSDLRPGQVVRTK